MAISTFMGLETNKRGLTAQQTALYTVGHNISNANTVGYTRQRVNLEATHGFPGVGMNAPMLAGHLGTGVTSQSITRVRNEFVDKQYRQETNNLGYWSQRTDAISQLEDIVSEPSEYGLNASYNDFYSAWQELANNPSSAAARQVVYTKAAHLASSFNYMNKQMTQVQANLKSEAINTVDKINSILEQITALNNQIKQVEPNGYIPNDIYDARDVLIDELSNYIPVTTERTYSGGLATDDSEGALQVYMVLEDGSKQALVSAEKSGTVQNYNGQQRELYGNFVATKLTLTTVQQNADGTVATDANGNPVTKALTSSEQFEAIYGITFEKSAATESLTATETTDANGVVTVTYKKGENEIASVTGGVLTVKLADANGTPYPGTLDPVTNKITLALDADTKMEITPTYDTSTPPKLIGATAQTLTAPKNIEASKLQDNKGKLESYFDLYGTTNGTTTLEVPLKYDVDANGNYIYVNGERQTVADTTNQKNVLHVSGYFSDKLSDLDKLANEFANAFNAIHSQSYGLSTDGISDSPTNLDFFNYASNTNANGAVLGKDFITAANISVNDKMKDFNNIAASDQNNEEGNGNIALKLSNLKTTAISGLNSASAGKFYESMLADIGTEGEKAVKNAYNSGTLQLAIENRRASENSVSLDEEMTNMIMFQQAYNASARMMTAIDEILDKVINGMGRVGL